MLYLKISSKQTLGQELRRRGSLLQNRTRGGGGLWHTLKKKLHTWYNNHSNTCWLYYTQHVTRNIVCEQLLYNMIRERERERERKEMFLKHFSLIFLFPPLILAFPQKSQFEVRELFATKLCTYIDHSLSNGKIRFKNRKMLLAKKIKLILIKKIENVKVHRYDQNFHWIF